jgi:hypothetical protein
LGDTGLDEIMKFLVGKPGRKKPRGRLISVDGRSKLKLSKYDTKLQAGSFETVRFQQLTILSKEMKITCQKRAKNFFHMCVQLRLAVRRTCHAISLFRRAF